MFVGRCIRLSMKQVVSDDNITVCMYYSKFDFHKNEYYVSDFEELIDSLVFEEK